MNLAIIPARGGSKRIPRKNIRMFGGKPMLAHAIEAARRCGLFEHIVVSTDDAEIAGIAQEWGAQTPFARPLALADDSAPTVPVIAHAIAACESLGWTAQFVCCIYPCVPFIRTEDLAAARELLVATAAQYCFPVAEFPAAIQRALRRDASGGLSPFDPRFETVRTQDLEPACYDAGQFYWGTRQAWLTNPRIHSSGVGLNIPGWRAIDIDTQDDWTRAELIYNAITIQEDIP